ncbi:MAG: CBS domain-containing protein [Nannocystaceae bacterium]
MIPTVEDWLRDHPRAALTVAADVDAEAMLARLLGADARELWVVDGDGRLVGRVDLHRLAGLHLAEHKPRRSRRDLTDRRLDARARELADRHVRAAAPGEAIDQVITRMLEGRLESLPVVDREGRVSGAILLVDLLRGL